MKTARLWIYVNGSPVRLSLRDGQRISYQTGGPTEEGYHVERETLERESNMIYSTLEVDSKDCDGRFSTHHEYACNIHRLEHVDTGDGPLMPAWEMIGGRQWDQFAEAMGY